MSEVSSVGRRRGGGPFGRLARRFRETVAELRKVVWPTRKQLVTYTIVVIVFVSVFCAYAAGLDFVFSEFMFWAFG